VASMAFVADQFQGNSSARRERGQPLAKRSMTSAKYACGLSPLSRADSTIVYMCAARSPPSSLPRKRKFFLVTVMVLSPLSAALLSMSDGDALALVHQEDGRHLHSAPHRSPDWASERWWLREDGFEFPGARQLGNRPIRPRAAPTSKVRKTLDTTRRERNDRALSCQVQSRALRVHFTSFGSQPRGG